MHDCRFEEKVIEMSGDIKTLLEAFKNMNGKLVDTKRRFDTHDEESKLFRHKVDTVWTVVHTLKWIVGSALTIFFLNKFF